ncbi:MAG: type II toxin-antitoxin system VapC family toxin [Actinomycetota bacterium]|nr:type II toxin-antitoxin system VapC family toxin [Actinomycetota bacterium]
MKLVDANVLLYAVNEDDPKHELSRQWLDGALGGTETVGMAWPVLLAFLRLSTRVGLFPAPLAVGPALHIIRAWLAQPTTVVPAPTTRHVDLLAGLLTGVGSGGNLVSDAHLAALALEYDATIVTYDSDFARFAGVRVAAPDA